VSVPMQAQQAHQGLQSSTDWSWLNDWRRRAWVQFAETPWPTRKTEAWKYTPLKSMLDTEWALASDTSNATGIRFDGWDRTVITLVDGKLTDHDALPDGVTVRLMSQATPEQRASFEQRLANTLAGDQLFTTFNQAMLAEAVWIDVAPETVLEKPLHINQVLSADARDRVVPVRLMLDLGARSQMTLVETFASEADGPVFINPVTEIEVGDSAKLTHYHLLLETGDVRHLGAVQAVMQAHSQLNSFHMALGGVLKRKDIVVRHCGSGADVQLNGVYLPTGKEHIDYHTTLEHEVPHGTSHEVFRGIIGDDAKAVFNGRIHIHKDAQKTLAELSNKNLLTSSRAEINTKPELEIYADDVKCAHGATIAQLDKSSLFYFQSRGINRKEAEAMLSFGFINELLEALQDEPVKQLLRPLLAALFAKDDSLARHSK